jgi:hypothetical protein
MKQSNTTQENRYSKEFELRRRRYQESQTRYGFINKDQLNVVRDLTRGRHNISNSNQHDKIAHFVPRDVNNFTPQPKFGLSGIKQARVQNSEASTMHNTSSQLPSSLKKEVSAPKN